MTNNINELINKLHDDFLSWERFENRSSIIRFIRTCEVLKHYAEVELEFDKQLS